MYRCDHADRTENPYMTVTVVWVWTNILHESSAIKNFCQRREFATPGYFSLDAWMDLQPGHAPSTEMLWDILKPVREEGYLHWHWKRISYSLGAESKSMSTLHNRITLYTELSTSFQRVVNSMLLVDQGRMPRKSYKLIVMQRHSYNDVLRHAM